MCRVQFDEGRVDMKDSVTSHSLKSFLEKHRYPLVAPFDTEQGLYAYYESHIKRIVVLFVDKNSPNFQTTINAILPVAHAFRGQVGSIIRSLRSIEHTQTI